MSEAYRKSGVDIDAAMKTKRGIREIVRSTFGPEVLTDIGAFGGLFKPDFACMKDPVLVGSADGVGTKLKVAQMTGRHDTVGQDLVNHCCNDILVMGARPLFFLDYLAYAKHNDAVVKAIISGIAYACREQRCALIGGEMAELPDVYHPNEYDLAGVIVGVVPQGDILDGSRVKFGDRLLGLASSGLHTNGYSLARKLVFETAGLTLDDELPGTRVSIADALLWVHRPYGHALLPLLPGGAIHAMAHITGGGFTGNIDRSLPPGLDAVIDLNAWTVPPLFRFLVETGKLTEQDAYKTFNMGIGMVLMVDQEREDEIILELMHTGETVFRIGHVETGSRRVHLVRGIG